MAALVLIRGNTPADKDYLAQIKRTAARFGGKIVGEKVYDAAARRAQSGLGPSAGADADPGRLQDAPEHDVVWVIDTDEISATT